MTENHRQQTGPVGTVRVGRVRIRGFRSLVDTSIILQSSTTVLIGANNSGKTSILEALATALRARTASEEDLHVPAGGTRTAAFTVDLTLVPWPDATFADAARTVLAQAVTRDSDGSEQVVIRATGRPAGDGSGISVDHAFLPSWPTPGEDDPAPMTQPRVGNRVLDLVDFTLLDAQRDLVEQLRRRRSTWGRILSELDVPAETAASLEDDLKQLGDRVVAASAVLAQLRDELQGIDTALGASVDDVSLAPLPPRLEELARGVDVLVSAPDAAAIPLRLQGMGSRSLAALTVFQAFARLRLGAELPVPPTAVTALEEPEAHLHPQAHGAVTSMIDAMPGQKIVSTHSPRVVYATELADLRCVRRRGAHVEVRAPGLALTPTEQAKVRHLVLRPHGDVLFARLVVIGDGDTEADALPEFMRAWWATEPEGRGVAVVEVPSLGDAEVPALVAFLEEVGISWLALVDGDDAGRRAAEQIGARVQRAVDGMPQLIFLPEGHGFERHLLTEGFGEAVREGIEAFYGQGVLEDFAASRGYPSEEALLFAFLRKHKSSYGAAVARAIATRQDEEGRPALPSGVRRLLERAEEVLEQG